MELQVLGEMALTRDGQRLALGGPQRCALIGLLAAARGRPVPVERIVDQLWGDTPPATAQTSLQVQVARLRREIEPDRTPRATPQVLVTSASGYALALPPEAVDAHRFETQVAAAAQADPATTESVLRAALETWRGAAYGGLEFVPALAAESVRLEELRLSAVEQLWEARLALGAHHEAVAALGGLVAEHPLRERLWASYVLALYRAGRQADALDAVRRVRAHLADELGLDPGTDLQRLEQAVLRQDPALDPPTPAASAAAPVDLAGREDWLRRTAEVVREVSGGSGRVVLVTGEPGIGKTRLAQAVCAQASAVGLRTAWGTWEQEGCPPLWGWTQALAERGFGVADKPDEDVASATFRLADLALGALSRDGGTCLVLDDVQWADVDSQRLLTRLAAAIADSSVLLLVLCREPLVDVSPGTQAMLAALARLDALRVPLGGLDAEDIRALVRERTGQDVRPETAERVRERTDGNPFYVSQLVRLLTDEGSLEQPDGPAWTTVPAGVRDVVRHRLVELPAAVGDLLRAAAVLGRAFDLEVLAASWDSERGVLEGSLELAVAAGLVVEEGSGQFRFAHALVRDAVYADISPALRGRAHVRAAQAIESQRVGHLDEHAVALFDHYALGGSAHARSAWVYAARAARRASARGSHEDAARLLAAARELQQSDGLVTTDEREQVQVALGTALRQSARAPEAWEPLAAATESALARGDGVAAARALLSITDQVMWSWRIVPQPHPDGIDLWQRVIAALPAEEQGLRAHCRAALAVELIHAPMEAKVGDLVDEAVHAAHLSGDEDLVSEVLQLVCSPMQRTELIVRRQPLVDELVELCARRDDERGLAMALCKRAPSYTALGRPADALRDLRRARVLAVRHHLAPVLMVVDYGLALLEQAAGDLEGSDRTLQGALAIQRTISMAGEGIETAQRSTALYVQGRMGEIEPLLRQTGPQHYILRELATLAIASSGDLDDLAASLGPWSEQPPLPPDYEWLSLSCVRGLVWSALGDQEAIAALRADLAPYADRVADGAMAAFFLGSVRHTLAALALAAGDLRTAEEDARSAVEAHRRWGWPLWEQQSRDLLDRVLDAAG